MFVQDLWTRQNILITYSDFGQNKSVKYTSNEQNIIICLL